MKYFLLILTTLLITNTCLSQILFFEDFDETDNSVNGVDNINSTPWSTSTPHSGGTSDYFKVLNNQLEGRDSNGPAYFETDDIDVSTCTSNLELSFDVSHDGTMEGDTASEYGCNKVDIIKLEYSFDSGSTWNAIGNPVEGLSTNDTVAESCGCTNSPSSAYPVPWSCGQVVTGPFIAIGNFNSFNFSECVTPQGNTFRIKITVMQWAGSEYHRIDNIQLECTNCLTNLPIELLKFYGYNDGRNNILEWITSSETNNDYFEIERSVDGYNFEKIGEVSGSGSTNSEMTYNFIDYNITEEITYYRLKQVDFDGQFEYHDIISIHRDNDDNLNDIIVYPNPSNGIIKIGNTNISEIEYIEISNSVGQVIYKSSSYSGIIDISYAPKGVYFLNIYTEDGNETKRILRK